MLATLLLAGSLVGVASPASAAPTWSVVPSPTPSGAPIGAALYSVSCSGAADCFAIGGYQEDNGFKTLAERWNGTRWSRVATPNSPLAGRTGSQLFGVSCRSASFCVAVGGYYEGSGATKKSLIEHWNGTKWSIVPSANPPGATFVTLSGVSCASATSCFAVGQYQAGSPTTLAFIERWNGTTWSLVASPRPAGATASHFNAVSCAASNRCAAVGAATVGGTVRPYVTRWNGTKWLLSPVPVRSGSTSSTLSAVSCSTVVRCVAVGTSTNAQDVDRTLIYRWNGTNWAVNTSPNPAGAGSLDLAGVSCVASTSCAAVGNIQAAGFVTKTFVLRWNGTAWSLTNVSAPNPDTGRLNAVSCVSDASCVAVGVYRNSENRPWALTWNGAIWSTVAAASPAEPGMSLLEDVACPSATECLAVGDRYATDKPLSERWNGTAWTTVATPSPSGSDATLADVSCAGTTCFAVGESWLASTSRTLVEQWNGATWSTAASPNPGSNYNFLYGVSCATPTSCFAVGGYSYSPTSYSPLVLRWNGTSWSFVASPFVNGAWFDAVSCTSATDCVAVGDYYDGSVKTLVERWNGTSWSIIASPNRAGANSSLVDVSCSSSTWCVAVGSSYPTATNGNPVFRPLIERWNGTSWAIATSPIPAGDDYTLLTGVSCASSSSCVAVGSASPVFRCGCDEGMPSLGKVSLIERWNGTSWAIEPSPEPAGSVDRELNGVTCVTGLPCVAVGAWQGSGMTTHTLVKRYS